MTLSHATAEAIHVTYAWYAVLPYSGELMEHKKYSRMTVEGADIALKTLEAFQRTAARKRSIRLTEKENGS